MEGLKVNVPCTVTNLPYPNSANRSGGELGATWVARFFWPLSKRRIHGCTNDPHWVIVHDNKFQNRSFRDLLLFLTFHFIIGVFSLLSHNKPNIFILVAACLFVSEILLLTLGSLQKILFVAAFWKPPQSANTMYLSLPRCQ